MRFRHPRHTTPLPLGDVLLHAGDLSVWDSFAEIQEQLKWLAAQPHAHKIIIAGNHDLLFDTAFQQEHAKEWHQAIKASCGATAGDGSTADVCSTQTAQDLVWGDVTYLQNESLELNINGGRSLKIYGSPDTPVRGCSAFQYPREKDIWSDRVPTDTDILITHGPPWGHLDGVKKSGCPFLAREILRVRPRLVLCGHIHVGYGTEERVFDSVGQAHEAILGQWGGWPTLFRMALNVMCNRLVPKALRKCEKSTMFVNAAVVEGYQDHKVKNRAVVLQI